MRIGVIIPSRLAPRPGGLKLPEFGPELWLDGALASVVNQKGYNASTWEIFVGVDPGVVVPLHIYDHATIIRGETRGQASAVNAAAKVALLEDCDVLAFLADDDCWHRRKTEIMLKYFDQVPFMSCSQRLADRDKPHSEDSATLAITDFPDFSGWMMTAALWSRLGGFRGFNTAYRWMADIEWLGRLNQLKTRRVHLKERGLRSQGNLFPAGVHSSLVLSTSTIVETDIPECLVSKTLNPQSNRSLVKQGGAPAVEATDEVVKLLQDTFGHLPW